jgi:putative protease
MEKEEIGKITHYFGKIGVAAIMLTAPLKVGDTIAITGASTDFEMTVDSMQLDRQDIPEAEPGMEIAIKVKERAREKDTVYKVVGE